MTARRGVIQIMGQGASVAATRIILIAVSFVSSVVVARALPIQERGKFGLLMAVGALAIQFGNFGLPVANTYLVARQPNLLSAIVANTIRGFSVVSVCLVLLLAGALRFVHSWTPLWGVAGIVVWFVAVGGLAQMLGQNLLIGRFQFAISNAVDVLARVGTIVGMLSLWFFGKTTASWFGFIAAVFGGIATCWGLRVGGVSLVARAWDGPLARQQFRLGARAYLACMASFIMSRLPLYAVESRAGLQGLAYYTQALVIADTMLVVPTAIGTVLFPSLAAASDVVIRMKSTLKLAGITFALMTLSVGVAAGLGPLLLPLIYGKAYAASIPVLLAMLPGIAAIGVGSVMQNALSANGYPWMAVASPFLGLAGVAVGLDFSGTIIGCAWAYSLGCIVMFLCSSFGWWLHRRDWVEIQAAAGVQGPPLEL